jgi:hypothetical protein
MTAITPHRSRSGSIAAAALALAIPLLANGAAQAGCPIAQARYTLTDDPQYAAGFYLPPAYRNKDDGLTYYVHSGHTNRTYWFFMSTGSARYTFLYSMAGAPGADWTKPEAEDWDHGPLPEMTIAFADRGYVFSYLERETSDPPPEYVLISDLPAALATNGKPPEHPPLGFFKFDRCTAPGSPPG